MGLRTFVGTAVSTLPVSPKQNPLCQIPNWRVTESSNAPQLTMSGLAVVEKDLLSSEVEHGRGISRTASDGGAGIIVRAIRPFMLLKNGVFSLWET